MSSFIVHFPTQQCMRQWMIVQSSAAFRHSQYPVGSLAVILYMYIFTWWETLHIKFYYQEFTVLIMSVSALFAFENLGLDLTSLQWLSSGCFRCRCAIKQKSGQSSLKSAFIYLFIPSMKIWTALSANSLEYKWNRAELTCCILFSFMNAWSTALFIQLIQLQYLLIGFNMNQIYTSAQFHLALDWDQQHQFIILMV